MKNMNLIFMKNTLGFDCKSFKPSESKECAFEQMKCFKKVADEYLLG